LPLIDKRIKKYYNVVKIRRYMHKEVSQAVIKRLPRYYRYLEYLRNNGITKVSSGKLAEMLDITASQVRQDFANFGGFGQQGYGYDVAKLLKEFSNIIGLNKIHNLIIIGAGNIGRALWGYQGFAVDGFIVKALFDVAEGTTENGLPIYCIDQLEIYLKENHIDIVVITTQAEIAHEVACQVVELGIKSIWNFAPVDLEVPSNVVVENISMSESLYMLSYKMTKISMS